MNELAVLHEAGPEGPALTPAARAAARAALLEEIEGARTARRLRPPSRRIVLRVGAGLAAVAAAWTTAVVVAAPDDRGTPAEEVTLVDFATPTFPLSLDPVPEGLSVAFDGDGGGGGIAAYETPSGADGFTVYVGEDDLGDVDAGAPGYRLVRAEDVTVEGRDAELVHYSRDWCTDDAGVECGRRDLAALSWERRDDQWVTLLAHGSYAAGDRVVTLAESLVDRPQPVTLSVGLAPAGWSVQSYKMGRVLTLVDDAHERQTLTVHVPLPEDVVPADRVRGSVMGPVGPQIDVTVHDRPAQLVRVDNGPRDRGWFLQAQFEDGTTFVLQVPDAFTEEQVLEFAEQVTFTP